MSVVAYEDVLPRLLGVLGSDPDWTRLVERTYVVRELRGRVRVLCAGKSGAPIDPLKELGRRLSQALDRELQAWHVPEVWTLPVKDKGNPVAAQIVQKGQDWPRHWPRVGQTRDGAVVQIDTTRLRAVQAVLSKGAWLSQTEVSDPWPLSRVAPTVISFFSFKGGVGRTTALAVIAWQLARAGKRVVVIDLDLEAPGLGQAFGLAPDRGVVDYLLSSVAAGRPQLDPDLFQDVRIHGANIELMGAGRLGDYYAEKLARLDFSAHELLAGRAEAADAPEHFLRALLEHLKGRPPEQRPDYVLLDSRAGLHDIGGLALHELSHVVVLVGRHNQQGLAGLDTTLAALGRRRVRDTRRIVIVHSYATLPADSEEGRADRLGYREAVYGLAQRHLYADEEDPPGIDATDAAHFPWAIGQYDELPKADALHRTSLAVLENDDFTALRRRIQEIALPTEEDPDEDPDDADVE